MKPTKYGYETYWTIERGEDAIDVTVRYNVDDWARDAIGQWGPPENYDPGNGWLFDIETQTEEGVTLTDDEIDAIHAYLESNPPEPEYPDYD